MSQVKKQSPEAKKRLQHQLYLARECPEPVFDLSACEISEIPSGVFSLCKVLQKEALLLHNNQLSNLKGGGSFSDLSGLRILDIRFNRLALLPDEIGQLQSLQVLNLDNNQLTCLPANIMRLGSLQTLTVKQNKIRDIPAGMSNLTSLRMLDVSSNPVIILPKELGNLRTLETLVVDANRMKYPPPAICEGGTESMMIFFCSELNIEYAPPSNALLTVLPQLPRRPSYERMRSHSANASTIADTVLQYENLKEARRKERLMLEKQLEEDQRQQALLAMQATANKEHLLKFVTEEHARMNQEFLVAQHQKEAEREKMRETLFEAERNACELVVKLLAMNEKARRTEELLEQMEIERMETEQWYIVRQDELHNIRRKDILASMEQMLEHNDMLGVVVRRYLNEQDDAVQRTKQNFEETDGQIERVINKKQSRQQKLIRQLFEEEALQKEAFEVLLCEKDARHKRISSQIILIEQELTELTLIELEQRQLRQETQLSVLEEKRYMLTKLLLQLIDERDKREKELHLRLIELEEQRSNSVTGYWLVQYQRLLDSKPQSLIDQEKHVEHRVVSILDAAGASDYLPQFALNRISIETLMQMTDEDLIRIGIHELGLRRAIMREIERMRDDDEIAAKKLKKLETPEGADSTSSTAVPRRRLASAPPCPGSEDQGLSLEPDTVTARGINTQCVICLDAQSAVLFLSCGHVCTCVKCSTPLVECPLDRCPIIQRIHLLMPPTMTYSPDDDDNAF